ncbi:MAG: ribosome silencing factor [Lachnospiraceae bacterium]|nr:ribosome silencing factor [Lachnospiraceae bacterium]MBO7650312.1 ribosome silencing factor [Lachnospiraceae bacterium]MCR5531957.1 ribosome silencing factor [Lachnospiraceae bacterium]
MTSKDLARVACEALEEKKGGNIQVINIGEVSTIADYFVICDGANAPQVEALVDNVKEKLFKLGRSPKRVEGMRNCGWILLDYEDVVVHVFSKQDRLFYDLERVWRDGKTVSVEELQ